MALVLLCEYALTAVVMAVSRLFAGRAQTNRKMRIEGSRFETTPVGATV